jgi:RNA polymerase sigma-70 factor (sigma-E family)
MEAVAVAPDRRAGEPLPEAEDPGPDAAGAVPARPSVAPADLVTPEPLDFDAVFAEQHDRLLRIAGLLCGDRDEAEDVVAEVFARTYRHWKKGGIDDISAYLRRGVVNEVRSRWRKRSVRRRIDARRSRDDIVDAPGADAAVGEADRLQVALLELPERQRSAIVLRFYDDRSEAETAAVLGVPLGTVKSSVSRGLARLAELLGEEEP